MQLKRSTCDEFLRFLQRSLQTDIPTHEVDKPLHVPLAWHVLAEDPLRRKPGSQLKSTLLGNTVELPEEDPFMGMDKGPQLTARKYEG